jgi:hypothetical protein
LYREGLRSANNYDKNILASTPKLAVTKPVDMFRT